MPRLHLNDEDLELLKEILASYDWFCDCDDWPDCDDFRQFTALKSRVETLGERSKNQRMNGYLGYSKARNNAHIRSFEAGLNAVQNGRA